MSEQTALHLKYRPRTLDDIVGHTEVVSKLRGMIASKKYHSALAFFGPTSAGKTTLARAFASSVLEKEAEGNPDWFELNAADSKTIDEVRQMIALSKLRPTGGTRRFLLVDEAQMLLSNPQAAAALLKPLEEPPKSTTWIIGSMDPDKFATNPNGRAMLTRCLQFHLKKPSSEDLHKQAMRIIKGEELTFFSKALRTKVVEACNGEMRTLANIIEGLVCYYNGLEDKPEKISDDTEIEKAMTSIANSDETNAVALLIAIYARKLGGAQRTILNVDDGFGFISKMLNLNWFLLNNLVLKGNRHPKVWASKSSGALQSQLVELVPDLDSDATKLKAYAYVQNALAKLKVQSQAFALPEQMAISSFSFETIEGLKSIIRS